MAEPRRAWMKLTLDSDSATPKTYSTHSETPRSETFFSFVWLCNLLLVRTKSPMCTLDWSHCQEIQGKQFEHQL